MRLKHLDFQQSLKKTTVKPFWSPYLITATDKAIVFVVQSVEILIGMAWFCILKIFIEIRTESFLFKAEKYFIFQLC